MADIAILVISAEDGVKPQTLEALKSILQTKTPYIVAINKIDKPGVNIDRIKQNLVENEIYIEGFGGDIPVVPLSAKTGQGVSELFDMIILVADLENLTGDTNADGEGIIIESNRDTKKGICATCIIKNGVVEKGMYLTSGRASAPVRIMENYLGKPLDKATFSSPVRIIGWDEMPEVGNYFKAHRTRKEARECVEYYIEKEQKNKLVLKIIDDKEPHLNTLHLIIKADTGSSLEAVVSEIKKLKTERIATQIIFSSIGTISENDIRLANGREKALILGFNVKVDSPAKSLAERNEIEIKIFDIIYKMTEWLKDTLETRTPKIKVEESVGLAKVLKLFSKVRDKQIIGARVDKGIIALGSQVKIIRRDVNIGEGNVRELQEQKIKSNEIKEGREFGTLVEAKVEIAPGDYLESFITTEK